MAGNLSTWWDSLPLQLWKYGSDLKQIYEYLPEKYRLITDARLNRMRVLINTSYLARILLFPCQPKTLWVYVILRMNLYNALYKRSSLCVRAAGYLDKGSPNIQESWATIRTQVRLLLPGNPRKVCSELEYVVDDRCWWMSASLIKPVNIKQNIQRGNVSVMVSYP